MKPGIQFEFKIRMTISCSSLDFYSFFFFRWIDRLKWMQSVKKRNIMNEWSCGPHHCRITQRDRALPTYQSIIFFIAAKKYFIYLFKSCLLFCWLPWIVITINLKLVANCGFFQYHIGIFVKLVEYLCGLWKNIYIFSWYTIVINWFSILFRLINLWW